MKVPFANLRAFLANCGIRTDIADNISIWGMHGAAYVIDASHGAGEYPPYFVLFSPTLSAAKLTSMITLLQQKQLPCGFSPVDARFHETVIAVGNFSQNDLDELAANGAQVKTVKTKTALAAELKNC